jgi:hypothetical protein
LFEELCYFFESKIERIGEQSKLVEVNSGYARKI